MAKITIRKANGDSIEISDANLTDEQILQFLSGGSQNNGHAPSAPKAPRVRKSPVSMRINDDTPDYAGFKKALSDSGRKFIEVIRQYPNGIVADEFAPKIGLQNAVQIGGITGGGLSKLASRFHVNLDDVYTSEKKFENGMRRTIYRPGKDISKVQ